MVEAVAAVAFWPPNTPAAVAHKISTANKTAGNWRPYNNLGLDGVNRIFIFVWIGFEFGFLFSSLETRLWSTLSLWGDSLLNGNI